MAFGETYSVGAASLDEGNGRVVHIEGALLLSNAVKGDTFEYAGRRMTLDQVTDNGTIILALEWPDEPFEDAEYLIIQDAPSRLPQLALARTLRDQYERLRIFDHARPLLNVKEFGVNAPPLDYAADDMCVVGSSPSGAFIGHINDIARLTESGSWFFATPEYGWHIISEVDPNGGDLVRTWNGDEWALTSGLAAGILSKGKWNSSDTFTNGNVIKHNFKFWIAVKESTNVAPGTDDEEYWIEYVIPGEQAGVPIAFEFDTDTTASQPSPGKAKLNAIAGSASILRLSKTDLYGGNRAAEIAWIGTANTSNQKGRIRLQKIGDIEDFRAIVMTVTDAGTSYNLTISSPSAPNGVFDSGDEILFYFDWRGDVGQVGATGPGYRGTSATALTVGPTTPVSFTTQGGLAYVLGSRYRLNKADDADVYIEGVCTSYNPTTGAFVGTVDKYKGAGAVNSWNLNLIGQPGEGYRATSTSSLAVGTGVKTLITQPNLAYTTGARARYSSGAAWMEGLVTAYNPNTGSLTINATSINNSGTYSDWSINVVGEPGAAGINGADGASSLTRVRCVDANEGNPATGYEAGDVIDGVTLAQNDIVLRATEGGDAADGLYVVPASGSAARHTGFDAFGDFPAAEFNVMEGDDYGSTKWRCISPQGGTIDEAAIEIVQVRSMDGNNNLSELSNLAAARNNLELGELATMNQSDLPNAVAMAIVFGG